MTTQEMRYKDGSVYSGDQNKQGDPHGFGALTLGNGTMFTGMFEEGYFSGLGVVYFPDSSQYQGEFKEGKFHGLGSFCRPDNMIYDGEFKDGQMCGQGLVTFPNGTHGLPRQEGVFQGSRLVRQEQCPRVVRKAREMADRAGNQTGRK